MALQFLHLPLPLTPFPVIGTVDIELIHITDPLLIWYVLEVFLSAVRACLPPLQRTKPVGEAGGTEVLTTACSEVSLTKDLTTDGADVLTGNSIHKLIIISTIAGRRDCGRWRRQNTGRKE